MLCHGQVGAGKRQQTIISNPKYNYLRGFGFGSYICVGSSFGVGALPAFGALLWRVRSVGYILYGG